MAWIVKPIRINTANMKTTTTPTTPLCSDTTNISNTTTTTTTTTTTATSTTTTTTLPPLYNETTVSDTTSPICGNADNTSDITTTTSPLYNMPIGNTTTLPTSGSASDTTMTTTSSISGSASDTTMTTTSPTSGSASDTTMTTISPTSGSASDTTMTTTSPTSASASDITMTTTPPTSGSPWDTTTTTSTPPTSGSASDTTTSAPSTSGRASDTTSTPPLSDAETSPSVLGGGPGRETKGPEQKDFSSLFKGGNAATTVVSTTTSSASPFRSFVFSPPDLPSVVSTNSEASFLKKTDASGSFKFLVAGQKLYSSDSPAGGDVAPSVDVHFEPIISLPELVELKTGEEDWTNVFCHRAELYKFDSESKQWKERGIGNIKILSFNKKLIFRILQRREQVLKVLCNHMITKDMTLNPMSTSESSWCWVANDLADDELSVEQFAVKFKNKDIAAKFKTAFEECQQKLIEKEDQATASSTTSALSSPTESREEQRCRGTKEQQQKMLLQVDKEQGEAEEDEDNDDEEVYEDEDDEKDDKVVYEDLDVEDDDDEEDEENDDEEVYEDEDDEDDDDKEDDDKERSLGSSGMDPNAGLSKSPAVQPSPTAICMPKPGFFASALRGQALEYSNTQPPQQQQPAFSVPSTHPAMPTASAVPSLSKPGGGDSGGDGDGGGESVVDPVFSSPASDAVEERSLGSSGMDPNAGLSESPAPQPSPTAICMPKPGLFASALRGQALEYSNTQPPQQQQSAASVPSTQPAMPTASAVPSLSKPGGGDGDGSGGGGESAIDPVLSSLASGAAEVFVDRCRLKYFDTQSNQWKERGVGKMKILCDKDHRYVVVMRKDETLRMCANHFILSSMKLSPLANSVKTWCYCAIDYSDEEVKMEQLAVEFNNPETAKRFKDMFEDCAAKANKRYGRGALANKGGFKFGSGGGLTIGSATGQKTGTSSSFLFRVPVSTTTPSTSSVTTVSTAEQTVKSTGFSITSSSSASTVTVATSISPATEGSRVPSAAAFSFGSSSKPFTPSTVAATPPVVGFSFKTLGTTSTPATSSITVITASPAADQTTNSNGTPFRTQASSVALSTSSATSRATNEHAMSISGACSRTQASSFALSTSSATSRTTNEHAMSTSGAFSRIQASSVALSTSSATSRASNEQAQSINGARSRTLVLASSVALFSSPGGTTGSTSAHTTSSGGISLSTSASTATLATASSLLAGPTSVQTKALSTSTVTHTVSTVATTRPSTGQGTNLEDVTLRDADSSAPSALCTLKDDQFVLSGSDIIDLFGLECDICSELFDIDVRPPKLLPCKHTVCLCCLIGIEKARAGEQSFYVHEDRFLIKCPICQHKVCQTTVESLPNDHRVVRGLDLMFKSKGKKNCDNACVKDNCQNNGLFCKTCNSVACSMCIALYHKEEEEHVVVKLDRFLEDASARFDTLERNSKKNVKQLKTRVELIQNIKRNLDVAEMIELKKIKQRFGDISNTLQQRKDELIANVKEKALQRRTSINTEFLQIGEFRSELQNLYDYYKATRVFGDARQTLKIEKKLIECEKKMIELPFVEKLCQSFEVNLEDLHLEKGRGDVEDKTDLKLLLSPSSMIQFLPN